MNGWMDGFMNWKLFFQQLQLNSAVLSFSHLKIQWRHSLKNTTSKTDGRSLGCGCDGLRQCAQQGWSWIELMIHHLLASRCSFSLWSPSSCISYHVRAGFFLTAVLLPLSPSSLINVPNETKLNYTFFFLLQLLLQMKKKKTVHYLHTTLFYKVNNSWVTMIRITD